MRQTADIPLLRNLVFYTAGYLRLLEFVQRAGLIWVDDREADSSSFAVDRVLEFIKS